MAGAGVSLKTVQTFLAQKRIAFVGVSREQHDIGVQLLKEFRHRGYEVFPVNPKANEISGLRCFARVQDIEPPPSAVLLLTSPAVTSSVIRDCAEVGVRYVWMHRGGGQGAVSAEAVEFCREHGIDVVPGQCPFMFLDPVRSVHRMHRFFVRITGKYPHKVASA